MVKGLSVVCRHDRCALRDGVVCRKARMASPRRPPAQSTALSLHSHPPLSPSTLTLHSHPPLSSSTLTLHSHPPLSSSTLTLHFLPTISPSYAPPQLIRRSLPFASPLRFLSSPVHRFLLVFVLTMNFEVFLVCGPPTSCLSMPYPNILPSAPCRTFA